MCRHYRAYSSNLETILVIFILFLQVFFNILIGAFAIGGAAPNMQSLGTARGAAHIIWEILDTVSVLLRNVL